MFTFSYPWPLKVTDGKLYEDLMSHRKLLFSFPHGRSRGLFLRSIGPCDLRFLLWTLWYIHCVYCPEKIDHKYLKRIFHYFLRFKTHRYFKINSERIQFFSFIATKLKLIQPASNISSELTLYRNTKKNCLNWKIINSTYYTC